MYRFSSNSFWGNYTFLNLWNIANSNNCRNISIFYSMDWTFAVETISWRKLFKGGNYMRKYGISSTDKILFSFQKWHWVWHILCLTTTAIAKDLSIELRSKGDPPKLLQHHVQQKLMSSYVPDEKALIEHLKKKDEFHTTRAPFRESPYKFEGRGIFQLPAQHN